MTTDTLHPLAAEYLERLRRAGRGLPPGRLRELLAEIQGHLSEAIDPSASDAQALTVIDKLGEPEAIIAAEMPQEDELPEGRGTREWARDKWIGTLVIPGGLATSAFIGLLLLSSASAEKCYGFAGGAQHCTSAPGPSIVAPVLGIAVLALLVLAPIATSVYLARRAA